MKKLFTLLLFCMLSAPLLQAQWIISLNVFPPNPTVNDNVMVVAECQFPSGGCDDKTLNASSSGPEHFLSAMHCVGMAAFICTSMDTFYLGNLAAGTHQAFFNLNMGAGPSPCTPGIVPGPTDSISFTVTTATGISEVNAQELRLLPNPGKSGCRIEFSGKSTTLVEITDMSGRVVSHFREVHNGQFLDLEELQSGTYLIGIYEVDKLIAKTKWVKEN